MSKTTAIKYELIDHGIDHAQYFQGCGTAFTNFDMVATGCGSNFAEALDDALEMIAQQESSEFVSKLEEQLKEDYGKDLEATEPNTDEYHEENEDSEMYYYVSIRYCA